MESVPRLSRRKSASDGSPLVSDVLSGFLEHLRVEESRAPTTITRYRSSLERFVILAGDCPVGAINSERLSIYKRRLVDAGLSAGTIATQMSTLRSLLRYLRNVRELEVYDPEKVKRPRVPKREVEYLTKEEVQRFLAAIPTKSFAGLRDRALAEVLCSTGMRISEALSLNRDQIDWEAKEAKITGKGNKERKVYFGDEALRWLSRYLEHRHDDEPALFVTQGYEPGRLRAQGSWRKFRRYAKLAGLTKEVYPHMLRHTMATTLLANGCPIGHIRVLLGHEHLTTTCRYYLGIMSDAEAKAAHGKFLSYEVNGGKDTNGKEPGRENIAA